MLNRVDPQYEEIKQLKEQLAREKVYLEDEIRTELQFRDIIGNSGALRNSSSKSRP